MAETKKITCLYVVTDSETSYDNIGDIDGGYFDKEWLKNHIWNHGTEGLLQQLAYMNYQIFEILREVNGEKSQEANKIGLIKNPSRTYNEISMAPSSVEKHHNHGQTKENRNTEPSC